MSDVTEYWNVSWPVPHTGADGFVSHMLQEYAAQNERDARSEARSQSRQYGHATVTNRAGLVATYVNGREWGSPQ